MNDDEYEPESAGMMPPGKLAISFFVVAGCYTLFIVSLFMSFIVITRLFFPDIFATLQTQDEEVVKKIMENNPESILTRELFWILLGSNAVLCFLIGWLAARVAPFGKFGHAVFLTILVFVTGLQLTIGAQHSLKWMFALLMAVLPIAVLLGARVAVARHFDTTD
jgi:hypothetical protein